MSVLTAHEINLLARIILTNRDTIRQLLDVYGYDYNRSPTKRGERSFITTAVQALFTDATFRQAADAAVITHYNTNNYSNFIGAIIGGVTSIIGGITSAIMGRKQGDLAQQIAAQQAQAQVTTAYLNLWGTEAMADSNVITGAYGLTTAKEYRNIALIGGVAVFSLLMIGLIGWGFYRVFFKK